MASSKFQESYDYDGIKLIVSGERDEDECYITKITAADSQVDIFDIFSSRAVCSMADSIDARLSREAREANAEARAERFACRPEFSVGAQA